MAPAVVVAAAVAGLSALAGCGSDDPGSAAPADPASSASSASSGPGPAEATPTQTPGPEGATGRQVETQVITYRLPEGIDWDVTMGGTSAEWWDDRTGGPWSIFQFEHNEGEAKDLDEIARSSLVTERRRLGSVERLDNRVVNGVEGWVLEHHGRSSFGRSEFFYEYGAVHGSYWTTLNFTFPKDNAATREVIDSVLASIEWKDF